MIEIPSKLIENAIREVAKLPGIGRKTALRLVLHLLKEDEGATHSLTDALNSLRDNIKYCEKCHNIADQHICNICASTRRDHSIICVVEDIPDVLAIENTSQFQGLYHVLGGIISPIEGIGPGELNIMSLVSRITNAQGSVREIIFALSPTMEGDTTAFYIARKLKDYPVKISSIARGVPIGGNIEYADEVTLGRSIISRTSYDIQE
jgi:recombination protein RecR